MVNKQYLTTEAVSFLVRQLFLRVRIAEPQFTKIVAIERGGVPIGKALASALNIPLETVRISFYDGQKRRAKPIIDFSKAHFDPEDVVLIVDDLVDTGDTLQVVEDTLEQNKVYYKTAVLFKKPHATVSPDFFIESTEAWIVFPWELKEDEIQSTSADN